MIFFFFDRNFYLRFHFILSVLILSYLPNLTTLCMKTLFEKPILWTFFNPFNLKSFFNLLLLGLVPRVEIIFYYSCYSNFHKADFTLTASLVPSHDFIFKSSLAFESLYNSNFYNISLLGKSSLEKKWGFLLSIFDSFFDAKISAREN